MSTTFRFDNFAVAAFFCLFTLSPYKTYVFKAKLKNFTVLLLVDELGLFQ